MSSAEKSIDGGSSENHISLDPEKNSISPEPARGEEDESLYLSGMRLYLIILGLSFAVILTGLVILSPCS